MKLKVRRMILTLLKENYSEGPWKTFQSHLYSLKYFPKINYLKLFKSSNHMGSSKIEKIQRLLGSLPERDIQLAEKFLKNREFRALAEIIDSDIYLVRKNQSKEETKENYANISIDNLLELKALVADYMSYLIIDDDSDLQYYEYD